MKRFTIVAIFMLAIMGMLAACGGSGRALTDAEAMMKLESYITDGDVAIKSILNSLSILSLVISI